MTKQEDRQREVRLREAQRWYAKKHREMAKFRAMAPEERIAILRQFVDEADLLAMPPSGMSLRKKKDTEEARRFWECAEEAAEEVRDRPEWVRRLEMINVSRVPAARMGSGDE